MSKSAFYDSLQAEVERIDSANISKRKEKLIESFTEGTTSKSPRAVIEGKEYVVFNSNDYLGLRHHPQVKRAEHEASDELGTGPGAVRFISGSFNWPRHPG